MSFATLFFAVITLPAASGDARDASNRPVMLDFTATWCGPCRQTKPAVEQLIRQGFPIKPVDIDQHPEMAEKYEVTGVPTFIVIDPSTGRELSRTSGAQPADALASLYNQAVAGMSKQARPKRQAREVVEAEEVENDSEDADRRAPEPGGEEGGEAERPEATRVNPKPWETVVRIKVHLGGGSIGFGSGTIIWSSPEESIVLTCAHIFKLERGVPTPPPSQFPRKITLDLFDGNLSGPKKNQVRYAHETFVGEAIDYDFKRDVGLIRFRPGRRLPYAKVVPPHWKPQARMGMITVGCSEGRDATAWNTQIVNPTFGGRLINQEGYEAIECTTAPSQGRSGGGLFTDNGYVAGVCDFAEPRGNHGLYASPNSIYHILDRNNLMALYAPVQNRPERLIADNGRNASGSPRRSPATTREPLIARGQSPSQDDPGGVSLPPPEMLGIKRPVLARGGDRPASARRGSWIVPPSPDAGQPANLKLDSSLDPDPFGGSESAGKTAESVEVTPETASVATPARRAGGSKWRAGQKPLPALAGGGVN